MSPFHARVTRPRSSRVPLPSGLAGLALLVFVACDDGGTAKVTAEVGPLDDGTGIRSQIVVISDLHLGADIAYSELNLNRKPLANFLDQVRAAPTVKELVIAGDMLDEWFVPATVDTYAGKDQADFVRRIATTNQELIELFNRIIQEGNIQVTYVPGNHDLTITAENVEAILPGIRQARDDVQGLGTYSPTGLPGIAIEHGHRYNFFCAPDPFSNSAIAPGSIMPPGYFFTRIATQHVVQKCTEAGEAIAEIAPNATGGDSQQLAYAYWRMWTGLMKELPITNKLNEKIIVTNIDGYTETYALNDLLPTQQTPGGTITMNLYQDAMENWDQRQTFNHVAVHQPTLESIVSAADGPKTDEQATAQYFTNPESQVRVVIFGHTHQPRILVSQDSAGQKAVYANTGTWIDVNPKHPTMTFVVITPQGTAADSQTRVTLYGFEREVMTEMATESLRL